MDFSIEKLNEVPLQVLHSAEGETLYNLADIAEKLDVKPDLQNLMKQSPMHISGKIVWGWRLVGGNLIESVFVDRMCAEKLLFGGATKERKE